MYIYHEQFGVTKMYVIGDELCGYLEMSRQKVILVAPFIKEKVLERLFSNTPANIPIDIYTRWRPEEIALGVSDLEVMDVVATRPLTNLWLCHPLHAKYYRIDNIVYLGSSNLTLHALGWIKNCNLELMHQTEFGNSIFQEFELLLHSRSIAATESIRDMVAAAALKFPQKVKILQEDEGENSNTVFWIPATRNPGKLYTAYLGNFDELTRAGQDQARIDLDFLALAPGADGAQFKLLVAAALIQTPLFSRIETFSASPRRFGEGREFLKNIFIQENIKRETDEAWQTVIRWIIAFLSEHFEVKVANYSEILLKK